VRGRRTLIWLLRNIGIHLWITTLITIPLSFYTIPGLTRFFPGINPITAGLVIIMGVVVVIGFLMDGMAKKVVEGLLKKGQAWERSGIHQKAEKNYIKALRMYDTFLLWPFSARKTARIIAGSIAKFKLNTDSGNPNFKLGTAVYLKMNPADEDIARLWLEQLLRSTIVTSFDQEVLSALAEKHYADTQLSPLMTDVFLVLERKDFIAKKMYHQVQKDPVFEKKYSKKIQDMIGRPDEIIQQKAPCKKPVKPVKKLWKRIEPGKNIQTVALRCVSSLKSSWTLIGSILSFLILSVGKVSTYIKEHEKTQFYLKAGFLLIISVWLGFFMITTLSHIFKSRAVEKEKIKIQIQVPKPFTIQVAAYLKQKHADRYVDVLKKKGINAIIKKVDGGGKTWFVVLVSEFIDKKTATAYGRKLVQQKIIDDFFVNNK
jgi:hypothetical protein